MQNTKHPIRSGQSRAGEPPLFSFAVIADTHINERDDTSSSPCDTNRFANDFKILPQWNRLQNLCCI